MPERTSAFEEYQKQLEDKNKTAIKGKPAREGKLAPVLDELLGEEENLDSEKSHDRDDEREDVAA